MPQETESKSAMNLQDYWAILVRRRWWLLAPVFLCWAAAWVTSWIIPPQYRSETLILIEQQKVPEQYVASNITVDLQEQLQSMTQQILSRTRLQRIIDQFHLYASEKHRLSPDEVVDRMRKDINIELVQTPPQPGRRSELTAFRIYYVAPRPDTAQQVSTQLTSLFIEENLQSRQQQSEDTTTFLSNQLEEARKNLAETEAKVREFKATHLGELPQQTDSNVQIMNGLLSRHQNLSQSLAHAQQQKLYLESLWSQYEAMKIAPDQARADAVPAINKELDRLRNELTAARARYTENHPDVRHLKEQLASAERLKKDIDAEAAGKKADTSDVVRVTSPAELQLMTPMIQIQGQMKANEREIKDTQEQLKRLEDAIAQYQARLNVVPIREQQLADLTRDYDQSKANYDSLLKKQMQSQLATNLEKRQQGQQFRILDPPSLPKRPHSPDRLKFSLFGLAGGIALGLGCLGLVEVIDNRVRSEKELEGIVPVRVLVGIPHLTTPREERRRSWQRVWEWSAAAVMLAVMVAGNVLTIYRR
ncbi:MAG: GumC family protein [Terriglobales bacterium]